MTDLAKSFEPAAIEARLAPLWERSGACQPTLDAAKPSFCIQLPPPNVTGTLHMGHGFNHTIHDGRADALPPHAGFNTLWLPGTDHAGIATQIVVERQLQDAGPRAMIGREAFLERVWAWKETSATPSPRRCAASATRWTGRAYFHDGRDAERRRRRDLRPPVRRGPDLPRQSASVHWDPVLQVGGLRPGGRERRGRLPLAHPLSASRTAAARSSSRRRAETMLGDTAVMVHPTTSATRRSSASACRLPLCDRSIPVIADAYVDREFGTGVVKVTPAHDANDYAVGQRHGLPMIGVLALDATINDNAPAGPPRFDRMLRRAQTRRRRPRRAGPARRDPKHRLMVPLRAHRPGHRADVHRPVVHGDDPAGRRRRPVDRRRAIAAVERGRRDLRPGTVDQHLEPVDEQHPGLVHLAPALVGHRIPAWYGTGGGSSSRAARPRRAPARPPATAAR